MFAYHLISLLRFYCLASCLQTLQLVHVTHSRAVQLHRRAVSAAAAASASAAAMTSTTSSSTATVTATATATGTAESDTVGATATATDVNADADADVNADEAGERARRQGATLRATLCAPIAIVCGVCDGTLTC
jgi:hypothetical protein